MSGLIHIYCGDGKGKTTAAIGLAIRCAGSGRRVVLVQFLKDGKSSEFASLSHVPNIEVIPQTRTFGFTWTLTPEEKREAAAYYTGLLVDAFRQSEDADLLVLDEVLDTFGTGMVGLGRLQELLDAKPDGLEVVLTGRGPAVSLLARADYVTEMKMVKHPFEKGVPAREGIEY